MISAINDSTSIDGKGMIFITLTNIDSKNELQLITE
jgi:hypothetical protein